MRQAPGLIKERYKKDILSSFLSPVILYDEEESTYLIHYTEVNTLIQLLCEIGYH